MSSTPTTRSASCFTWASGGLEGRPATWARRHNPMPGNTLEGMSVAPDGSCTMPTRKISPFGASMPSTTDHQSVLLERPGRRNRGTPVSLLRRLVATVGVRSTRQLNRPRDVAFGPDGSLYIADYAQSPYSASRSGINVITTFAGGGSSFGMATWRSNDHSTARPASRLAQMDPSISPITMAIGSIGSEPDGRMTKVAVF